MPLKYRIHRGRLTADRRSDLFAGSVLVADRTARFYGAVLPEHATGVLVDLGAGTAPLRALYDQHVTRSFTADWPASLHDGALDVALDLNTGLPLAPGSLDTALASDVLEHLRDPQRFLRETCAALRPGGKLIGNVPFLYWLHEEPHDHFRYTEHGLRLLLTDAGFTDIDIRVLGGGVDVLVDVFGKLLTGVPRVGAPLARAMQTAWARVSANRVIAGRLSGSARKMPLSYGFIATAAHR